MNALAFAHQYWLLYGPLQSHAELRGSERRKRHSELRLRPSTVPDGAVEAVVKAIEEPDAERGARRG